MTGIVCHHGTAGGGHYTAYALNPINEEWYEFDDSYVTQVEPSAVVNAEAYVLFYRKNRLSNFIISFLPGRPSFPNISKLYLFQFSHGIFI